MDIPTVEIAICQYIPEITRVSISDEVDGKRSIVAALVDHDPEDKKTLLNAAVAIRSFIYLYSEDNIVNVHWYYLTFSNLENTDAYYLAISGNAIEKFCAKELTAEEVTENIEQLSILDEVKSNG